jgi:phenylacetate-CoA ligase
MTIMRIYKKVLMHFFLILYNPYILYFFYFRKKKSQSSLKNEQLKKLKKSLIYSYENIPFYKKCFDQHEFNPYVFSNQSQLEVLPILTKDIINDNIEMFKTIKPILGCKAATTGGSTGTPFAYKMSIKNRQLGLAMLLQGWRLGGYNLGDPVAILAGGSLVSNRLTLIVRLKNYLLNTYKFSSYGMDNNNLNDYYKKISHIKPFFLRGYPSAIFLFAEYLQNNNLKPDFKLKAIFTTAEMLFPKQRLLIEKVFNCSVFNGYGLNDGAIAAAECSNHNGFHIDSERGLMEVVDEQGIGIIDEQGKILGTTLEEKCMPLIRYDTGDLGVISDEYCPCGNEKLILKKLEGRITDFLKINGKLISSPVLTILVGKTSATNYQIEQMSKNKIIINMVYNDKANILSDQELITTSLKSKLGDFELAFNIVDQIAVLKGKKYKFIINHCLKD